MIILFVKLNGNGCNIIISSSIIIGIVITIYYY